MKKTFIGIGAFLILSIISVIIVFFLLIFLFLGGLAEEEEEFQEYAWGGKARYFADNEVPANYIPLYKKAAKKYDLDWELLAAIHRIETRFSTISPMVSHVGAEGHAQFMPCTWVGWQHPSCTGLGKGNIPEKEKSSIKAIKKYGGYGVDGNGDGKADMWDLNDAIYSMANYLSASYRSTGSIDGAILRYNHSTQYLNDVKKFMNQYKTNLVAVDFGDNNGSGEIKGPIAWPVPQARNITSLFNPKRLHPKHGVIRPHNGIDIASGNDLGKSLVAFMDGEVVVSQFGERGSGYGGYGYVLVIQHENNVKSLYAHMNNLGLPVGTKVKKGQVVGILGNSGVSTGPHLHFEIHINGKPVDPMIYLKKFRPSMPPK